MGLIPKLRLAKTLVVIDTHLENPTEFVTSIFDHGADMILVRDQAASLDVMRNVVETAQRIAMPRNKLVAVTCDVEVAREVMADVFIGGPDQDAGLAHSRLHEFALVGLPVFDQDACRRISTDDNVELAMVGPVNLPPGTTAKAPGLDLIRFAAEVLPVADAEGTPWFAVGGITPETLAEVIAVGARRVGVVVSGEADLPIVRQVSTALAQAWADDPHLVGFAFKALSNRASVASFPTDSGQAT